MAAPAFRSSAHANSASANSLAVGPPASIANGDILLLWVYYESDSAVTVTPPSGFAEVTACAADNATSTPDIHVRLYWKRAASESGSYTVGFSASVAINLTIAAYSGAVGSGNPIEAGDKTTGTGNATLPSITTLTADTLIVGGVASFNWGFNWSSSALTEHADADGQAIYDASQAGAGASGTKLITQSGSDDYAGTICNLASTALDVTGPAVSVDYALFPKYVLRTGG